MQLLQSLKTAAVETPELKDAHPVSPFDPRTPSCIDGLTKPKALLQTKLLLLCNLLVYIVKQIIILNALAFFLA